MPALAITITPAGLAAAINADHTGTGPLKITEIGLMSTPSTQIKRLTTLAGESVADNIIHITVTDETADTYTLTGIRLYTNTGILFATYDQGEAILEKGVHSIALLSADILLTSVPPGSVSVGPTGFTYPSATTTRQGVIEIATDTEVQAGIDTSRAITPAGLQANASTTAPAVNGAPAIGSSKRWARSDHVHPVDTSRQAALGYTPVQQGTGVGQTENVIKIGWNGISKLKATVDNGDLGNIAFEPWVDARLAALVNSSPAALDTLSELATAMGNDPNFATTITNALASKASKSGDTFTGPISVYRSLTVTSTSGSQVDVSLSGYASAYLYSDVNTWGLYSPGAGDSVLQYQRSSGKTFIGGVDTSKIVQNNGGTYGISISGTSAYSTSSGYATNAGYAANSDMVDGYHAGMLWRDDRASFLGATNGFEILPSGKIEMWGEIYVGNVNVDFFGTWVFPFAFPNSVFQISVSLYNPTGTNFDCSAAINDNTNAQASFTVQEWTGTNQNITIKFRAIGR